MKRLISKMIIAAFVAMFVCNYTFAASAKVTYVKGKVEVSRGNAWVSLKVGDSVNESETISTGFQSEARLNYNGSVMAVPALSRVTLEALQSSDKKETVSIKVDTGAVRSKVAHTEGKKIEYTARTPVGVASVRGTDFAVFAGGKARVYSGAIAYYKASDFKLPTVFVTKATDEPESEAPASDEGPATATTNADDIIDNAPKGAMVVGAGQTSTIDKSGKASKPVVEAKKRANKVKSTVASASAKDAMEASMAASGGSSETAAKEVKTTGSISVNISLEID